MSLLSRFRLIFAALGLVFLAACDTAEERAEGHYQRGLTLLEAGEESKALLEFKNAIQLNERAIGPRIEFAKIRTKQGELKGAIGNYLKVIEVDEEHLESRIAVSTLLLQWDRDTERSSEHINIADELAPDNLEVRGLVAALAQKEQRFEEANQFATALLADDPGNSIAVSILVAQKVSAEDHEGALELLNKALADAPDELGFHVAKLQSLEFMRDQDAITDIAIAHLENLLDQDLSEDDKHDSQAQRAAMLRAQGRTEEALEVVEGILKADQNHVESLKIRALSEIDSDKPHNAISDLRTALSVQAQDPDILMLLALAHERNGSVGLAQERLALAVQAVDRFRWHCRIGTVPRKPWPVCGPFAMIRNPRKLRRIWSWPCSTESNGLPSPSEFCAKCGMWPEKIPPPWRTLYAAISRPERPMKLPNSSKIL